VAADDEEFHVPGKEVAVLHRYPSKEYRTKGLDFLQGDRGRTGHVYDNDDKIVEGLEFNGVAATKTTRREQAAGYHLDRFRADNYHRPYKNMGHHLVPCETFKEGSATSPGVFSAQQLEVLRRIEFDVNEGRNIIFLPGFADGLEIQEEVAAQGVNWRSLSEQAQERHRANWRRAARRGANLHQLPCHWDFHSKYSKLVFTDCANLRSTLKKPVDKMCKEWKPPRSIRSKLTKLENDYWSWVVRFGEKMPRGNAETVDRLVKIAPPRKGLGRASR
jgi:hypothetical protein